MRLTTEWDDHDAHWDQQYGELVMNARPVQHMKMHKSGMVSIHHNFDRDSGRRGWAQKLGVEVVGTGDSHCPKFFSSEGEPVKRADVTQNGQQMILVDYDHNVAVPLGGNVDYMWRARVSKTGLAYYPHRSARPVGVGFITVSRCDRRLAKRVKTYLDEVTDVASLMLKVQDEPVHPTYHNGTYHRAHCADPYLAFRAFTPVNEMVHGRTADQLRGVVQYARVHMKLLGRVEEQHTYLRLKP